MRSFSPTQALSWPRPGKPNTTSQCWFLCRNHLYKYLKFFIIFIHFLNTCIKMHFLSVQTEILFLFFLNCILLLGFQVLLKPLVKHKTREAMKLLFLFFFLADCDTERDSPLINSCSLAEMTLLRWALCSLQSFSASSQVCLWVKYLQDGEWRHKSAFFIYYASRRV